MALPKNPQVDLKAKYQCTFELGLIFALSFMILAFKFFPEVGKAAPIEQELPEIIKTTDIPLTKKETLPPPPEKPKLIDFEPMVDEDLPDVIIDETDLDPDANVPKVSQRPPVEKDEDEVPFEYFSVVEKLPKPVTNIQSRIAYPEIARKVGIQGTVVVKAFINENGDVTKVELLKGIGGGCDEEALRVVKETKFEPGEQRGKKVRVQVSVNIKFMLN